jgi:hypothetical protein
MQVRPIPKARQSGKEQVLASNSLNLDLTSTLTYNDLSQNSRLAQNK